MSDVIVGIYLIFTAGLAVAIMIHAAMGHRRMVATLIWLACIAIFVSTVGGFILLGTFTPNMADYNRTSSDIYNAFTWGGVDLPEYSQMLSQINTLGAVVNAMGLGVLVMATLSGFFPKTFFAPVRKANQTQTH